MARGPEHWKENAPNESEPRRFLRKSPPLFWWVVGGLAVLTVIGIAAALLTEALTTQDNETDQDTVAAERPERRDVSLTSDGFEPGDTDVPRNFQVIITNDREEACEMVIEGNEGHAPPQPNLGTIAPGEEATWTATEPGQYAFHCADDPDNILRVTVP